MTTKPTPDITLTIDGLPVTVPAGTVFDAARLNGIAIPHLPPAKRTPVGVCRLAWSSRGRVYAASCIRPAEDGMKVHERRMQRPANADGTADGGSSLALRPTATIRRLRTGTPRRRRRSQSRVLPNAPRRAAGRFFGLSRSTTNPASCATAAFAAATNSSQLCARPPRQRIPGRHRFRHQSAHGRFVMRFLRRMHGLVPHRRADEQARRRTELGRRRSLDPAELLHLPF